MKWLPRSKAEMGIAKAREVPSWFSHSLVGDLGLIANAGEAVDDGRTRWK